jgi:hypothetical protein
MFGGCGRIGFDPAIDASAGDAEWTDGASATHDEDGDGVVDADDVCPHLPGSQLDSDSDGVGDDCDWEPNLPRQRFALFATMQPGHPFTIAAGNFIQGDDALRFDGAAYGELEHGLIAGEIEVDIGVDVIATVGSNTQHQIALGATGSAAVDFGEVNEQIGSFSNAAITRFDGVTFVVQDGRTLPSNIHPGALSMRMRLIPGGAATVDIGWPGEPYHLVVPNTVYTNTTQVGLRINNTNLDLRYFVVIAGG